LAPDDKNKEELHIRIALQNCGYPNWIFEKVKKDQQNKELKARKTNKKSTSDQRDRTGSHSLRWKAVGGYRKDFPKFTE